MLEAGFAVMVTLGIAGVVIPGVVMLGTAGVVTLCACARPVQAIEASRVKPNRRFSMSGSPFRIEGQRATT
jgi:hypothetical protein